MDWYIQGPAQVYAGRAGSENGLVLPLRNYLVGNKELMFNDFSTIIFLNNRQKIHPSAMLPGRA